ncbi:MAG: hypothetical protein ACTHOD_12905 [Motilibacteraceae bacterium]
MTGPADPFPGPQRPDGPSAGGDRLDAVRRVFADEQVVPLVPRPGTFETILAESDRRRRAHRRHLGGGAVALVAAAAAVAVAVPLGLLPDRSPDRSTTTVAAASTSPAPRPSAAMSALSASTQASVAPAPTGLPTGGPVPPGSRVVSVTTAAAGTLYALGSAPCGTPPCGVLVRSQDDGVSWVGLRPPQAAVVVDAAPRAADRGHDPAGSIRDVRFAGPRDGWAFGASTWVTHDGAAQTSSWRQVDTGGTVLDLATDGTTVWALAADCRSARQGTTGICTSPRLLTGPADGDRLSVDEQAAGLLPAQVQSASVQVAAGQVVVDLDGPDPAVLLRGDQGWQRLPAAPPRCADPTVVPAAQGGGVLWSICPIPGSGAAGASAVGLAISADGGKRWADAGTVQVRNGVTVLAAVDASRAAVASGAAGLGGSLQVTADRGAHWAGGQSLPWATSGWAWVGAAGGGRLLALPLDPSDTVWASDDAGRTWRALTVR